jgi:hypothetical protein
MQINSIIKTKNTFNYAQLINKQNILLSIRSDIQTNKVRDISLNNQVAKVVDMYKKELITYSTLFFIFDKFENIYDNKKDIEFIKVLTELGWESGLLKNKEVTFIKK